MKKVILQAAAALLASALVLSSCSAGEGGEMAELRAQLSREGLGERTRCAVISRLAGLLRAEDPSEMTLFLTGWVENHPDDSYNGWWLYMVAMEHLRAGSSPVAEHYFERVVRDCPDLTVGGRSVHFSCLQNLIKISGSARNRIGYYTALICSFPESVSTTELYVRLALEYEKEGEWENALRAYSMFLAQPDASTIQIPGLPDAYSNARKMVDFSKSPKDWTFDSLGALERAVRRAIGDYSWDSLDSFRSKSNFFMMSWKATEGGSNTQAEFSMRKFMRGNKIRCNAELDESSNPNEAYLRTSGWNNYVGTWYLYFRKVNFPIDPEIHGRWEWAGIYLGEKL